LIVTRRVKFRKIYVHVLKWTGCNTAISRG